MDILAGVVLTDSLDYYIELLDCIDEPSTTIDHRPKRKGLFESITSMSDSRFQRHFRMSRGKLEPSIVTNTSKQLSTLLLSTYCDDLYVLKTQSLVINHLNGI